MSNDLERTLAAIRDSLDQWGRTVPRQAVRFHEWRSSLAIRVQAEMARWFGPSREAVDALVREARGMAVIAQGLESAFQRAWAIRQGSDHVLATVTQLNDGTLLTWVTLWRNSWEERIKGIGYTAQRVHELELDFQTIQMVEAQIEAVGGSLRLLSEAQGLLAQLVSRLKADALRADLSELREKLINQGPSLEWKDAIMRVMEPLRALASEPPPAAPNDLGEAYRLATDAQRWAEALAVPVGTANDILSRVELAQRDSTQWGEVEIDALLASARACLSNLRDEAKRRRVDVEEGLRSDIEALQDACGAKPELAEDMRRVERMPHDEPFHHEQWQSSWPRARQALFQEVSAHARAVQAWIKGRRGLISSRLSDLGARALPEKDLRARAILAHGVESAHPVPEGAEPLLEQLHTVARWIGEVTRLEASASATEGAIERQRSSIEARHAELSAYESALGRSSPDLFHALNSLRRPSGPAEAIFERLEGLEKQLAAREAAILHECRQAIASDMDVCRRATALVRTVLPGVTEAPPAVWPASATVAEAMKLWDASKKSREDTTALVTQATSNLAERLPEIRARLTDILARRDLPAEQRKTAEEVHGLLQMERLSSTDPFAAFDQLKRRLGRADVLLNELTARENEALRLLTEIDRMLLQVSDEGLGKYVPDVISARVRLLRTGAAAKPRQVGATVHQLDEAHKLFERALLYARRLAAADLARACEAVQAKLRAGHDSAFAARTEPILAELNACPSDQLPPADVRERVIQLAASAQRGGRHG